MPEDDDGGTGDLRTRDMAASTSCTPDPVPTVDFGVDPKGMPIVTGNIGSACTKDADCKQGASPKCWKARLLDSFPGTENFLTVADGYCTSYGCKTDTDCGGNNLCLDFGTPYGSACLAGCDDAVTCRKSGLDPGYSCAYMRIEGNTIFTGCWPNGNLTCNPKDSVCTDPRTNMDGGCYRQAINDARGGECYTACSAGDFCDDTTQQCLYLDFTDAGDGFRGTLCFPAADMPKDPGATCMYTNDCADGYECDNRMAGSHKCEKLCNLKGKNPKCTASQFCEKSFSSCEAGLCKPQ